MTSWDNVYIFEQTNKNIFHYIHTAISATPEMLEDFELL